MSQAKKSSEYWDTHPIGAEIVVAELGSKEFYDHYLKYYDDFYGYKRRVFRYDDYGGKSVLEIGCGLGIDTLKWAKAGAQVTAIDASTTSVECTKKLLGYNQLDATIQLGDAQQLVFSDESFDIVYIYGVLMHVHDDMAAVKGIHRVLRKGGTALAVVYNRWSWYWLLVRLTGTAIESEEGDPFQNRVYSRRQIRRMFREFSAIELSCERPPLSTRRRKGILAKAFNNVFVPVYNALPSVLTKPFGWHLIVKAVK